MLTVSAAQVESLWDEVLPVEVRELPADLVALDVLLEDPELMWPLVERWQQQFASTGRRVLDAGRPTIAMQTFVRLMVLKQRHRWGYRTLVAEVSDSIDLRRFCRIPLCERVPDESTVRKLVVRIGPETISEICRGMIETAVREKRFRPRAVRIDSMVVEADVKYPTDAGLASSGVRVLAREGRKLATLVGERKLRVQDRWRSMVCKLRAITRTIRRRSGQAKERGAVADRTDRRAVDPVGHRGAAGGRGGSPAGAGARRSGQAEGRDGVEEMADRCEKVASQIRQRVAGQPIKDRIVSLHDPDARPIRKGKLGKPNEFGYVVQIAEVTEHTRRGARGLIQLAAASRLGNPHEDTLLPDTIAQMTRLQITVREVALDGGFTPAATNRTLQDQAPERVFIAGRQQPGSRRTRKRLALYRTATEGRISHLKRRYGLDRSRLKGGQGRRAGSEWAILAYNADTIAIRTR